MAIWLMLLSSLYAVVSISIVTVIATAIYTAFFFVALPSLSHPSFVSHPFHICMLFLAINSLDFLFRLQTLPHITMHNLFLSPSQ